ncbi:MAG: hypothetical protein NC336_07570 [Clostridium sp.]|nr:hypothetical protein [Clostridium sp.]
MKLINSILLLAALAVACQRSDAAAENWMTGLPDDVRVRNLSIPGAHDAATGEGFSSLSSFGALFSGVTQTLTIAEQWEAGIRAFDLRPTYKAGVDGSLQIYHGILETKVSMKQVLETLSGCLESSPGETAVIIVRHENDSDNNAPEWVAAMEALLEQFDEQIATFSPTIKLGEARGKMIILSRDNFSSDKAAMISGWNHSENIGDQKSGVVGIGRNRSTLCVQDFYECQTADRKFDSFRAMFEYSVASVTSTTWVINHASGYTESTGTNSAIIDLARDVNPRISTLIANSEPGRTGIVMLDFAGTDRKGSDNVGGAELAARIIEQNTRYIADESTGSETIDRNQASESDPTVYDLTGRRLGLWETLRSSLPKGIYIVNGKKIQL